ncbi:MAG: cupin domain-containing protein [Acidobacteria bacterium]|nr:cupin domain-containing protein [Acidobacteriota bacterium]MDA1234912.1 cupin domain-containing protein [Acidobacteriota bacterium]
MKNRVVLSLLFCVGVAVVSLAVGQAQRPAPPLEPNKFGYWSGKAVRESVANLKAGERPAFEGLNRGEHNFSLSHRDRSGAPEMHANWTDIYFIESGEGTLTYGGKLEGAEERRPGEFGGGKIVGGKQQKLVAGDIASSPAGMPHQWLVEDGKTLTYVTVKVAKIDDMRH